MKNNDKTLVVLTPGFPGSEEETYWIPFLQQMILALKRNSPGLTIIVLSFIYPYRQSKYAWHGIEVISFDGMQKRKLKRVLLWRRIWKELNNIRLNHNIVGLFSVWCGECAFIGKYFSKRYSIQHCTWICGQDALKTNKWVSFIRPKKYQLAAMSVYLVNEFYKNHRIKPQYIIPNAINLHSFPAPISSEKDIDILAVGSLIPLKQYHLFVDVVAAVRNKLPKLKAFHCGTGDEKEKIEAQIKELGLEDNLQLLGVKKLEEVLQLMHRTKAFLHTSRFEGFGAVCLEALYAGAHVISFHYPLDHSVPHWHVAGDTTEMTSKALELLESPDTEYSSVLVYSMDDSAKALMALFENGKSINQIK